MRRRLSTVGRVLVRGQVPTVVVVPLVTMMLGQVVGDGLVHATDPAVTLYACLGRNGTLSNVNTSGPPTCGRNDPAVSWNQVGPQGPQGPAGTAGPTGPQGPAGKGGLSGTLS